MGRYSRLGNDLYTGQRIRQLRRPQVALVRRLDGLHRRSLHQRTSSSRASTTGSSSPAAPRCSGLTLDNSLLPTANPDTLREAVAGCRRRGRGQTPLGDHVGVDSAILVQIEELTAGDSDQVAAGRRRHGGRHHGEVSQDEISALWGEEVGQRAALGVLVFLGVVVSSSGVRSPTMEAVPSPRSSRSAHDIIVTVDVLFAVRASR